MIKEDIDKLNTIYEIYEQPMYRIAYAILKNHSGAEDAVSDAFMKIIRKIRKIDEASSSKTKGYIIRIIRSAAIDQYRKNKKFYSRIQCIDDEIFTVPDNSINIESEIFNENTKMLNILNETDKRIMILRCIKELPWKEIAEHLKLNEATVRKRFERARKKIINSKEVKDYEEK